MRYYLFFMVLLVCAGCKSPGQHWINSLADFKEVKSSSLTLQALKIKSADTNEVSYKLRIYPSKTWMASNGSSSTTERFFYQMDSAFTITAGNRHLRPQLVQPVANGLSNCFEYLITINLDDQVKMKALRIAYHDKFIDGKSYSINL